ncbi:transcriptional regulator, partial [Xylella fastidiosa subsp. multiplex]|nr:transcriptional regulator [Xylella fastidiosa subsp. multiplex]
MAQRTGHRAAPEHTHPDDVPVLTALAALADPVRIVLVRELADSGDWTRSCGSFDMAIVQSLVEMHGGYVG